MTDAPTNLLDLYARIYEATIRSYKPEYAKEMAEKAVAHMKGKQ